MAKKMLVLLVAVLTLSTAGCSTMKGALDDLSWMAGTLSQNITPAEDKAE